MELWRYYRILRRRKWLIIIGTMICIGIVFGIMRFSSQKWEAYTTVMEKLPGDEEVSIYSVPLYQVDVKVRLANLTQLVKSQTVMQRSVETLSRLDMTADPITILKTLNVVPVLDTTLLSISVRSDSAAEARATADVVATEFIRFYNEINYGGAARSKQFIESQLPLAEARLTKIREELRKFKEESGVVMLPSQTDTLIREVSQFQTGLADYSIRARQASTKMESLEKELSRYPETREVSKTVARNPIRDQLESELNRLEIELAGMKRRKAAHPDMEPLIKRRDEIKDKLSQQLTLLVNSQTEATNPIHDNLVQQYISAVVEYESSAVSQSATQTVLDAMKGDMESLPAKEMHLAQLTLEEDAAKNTYYLLRQKKEEAHIKENEAENISSVQIVDPAQVRVADQKRKLKLGLALVLSPLFCAGIAFLLNYLDNTVKTPAEAEQLLRLPIFAVVPLAKGHLLADPKHYRAVGASYQMLSTNLWVGSAEMQNRTLLVASAEPDVGRSTTAANLAVALARDGARVILVDSDLRQPKQHLIFGVDNDRGLSNILAGQLPLKDAIKPTTIEGLVLIPSGPLPSNPIRLFRSPEMAKLVREINELADLIIFDSPAGVTFADSALLAALIKNVIIVHAAGSVPRGAEDEFRSRLEQVQANLLGAVLNMVKPEESHGYYHYQSAYEDFMTDAKHPQALAYRNVSEGAKEQDEGAD